LKSGSLNLLEHSGPVQVCNGTALPLPFTAALLASHRVSYGIYMKLSTENGEEQNWCSSSQRTVTISQNSTAL
jgi:hypothetical protein